LKRKLKKKTNVSVIFILIILAIVIIIIFISPVKMIIPNATTPETGPSVKRWNCGDIQIDVNSVKEAISYTRFGVLRPAPPDSKFEVFSLTVTNKGTGTKDLSGYRLGLLADGTSYSPVLFSSIEKITLLDGSSIIYDSPCRESKLASISRLVLGAGESETGCKIFQILRDLKPKSLNFYDLSGLKCSVGL